MFVLIQSDFNILILLLFSMFQESIKTMWSSTDSFIKKSFYNSKFI